MTHPPIYISRQQAESFLAEFANSLNQPSSSPILFQVWGIGGVGKSTLLNKLQELHKDQADFAKVSFGYTMGIETPLKLMAEFYKHLPKPPNLLKRDVRELLPKVDSFTSLYDRYQETSHQLETQSVDGKKSVDSEQVKLVKQLLNTGVSTVGQVVMPGLAAATLSKATELSVDAAAMILSEKDRIQQLLQQHQATKQKKELQELMLDPLPKLTQAFVQGVTEKGEKRPVILMLDTYEKAPSDIDFWLCHYLLANPALKSRQVRVVIAGRFNLLKTEYWLKLSQDTHLIYQQSLERFDREQTAAYLQPIGIPGDEVEDIYQATKGLPYYLDWLRREKLAGREIDFSIGNQAIVDRLLQGLNQTQKLVLQLAACCRWFDKGLIRHVMQNQGLDFDTIADGNHNGFEWLKQREFVEFAQHRYRLDDVARDVFRLSFWQEDREQFDHVHGLLADYFKQQADREVSPDSPPPQQYNNEDWRCWMAEFLYHSVFARRKDYQRLLISHLFASRYFRQDEVVKVPVQTILAEADLADKRLLNKAAWEFIETIKPAVEYGWEVLQEDPINWEFLKTSGFSKPQIEVALRTCFNQINWLDGLAKFAALLYKSKRCSESQRVDWMRQAATQAELIVTPEDSEFSSDLFLLGVGNRWYELERYEEALASYDKAIEIKPDYYDAWNRRGNALFNLGSFEEALACYDKAIEIKPDYHYAWDNRGLVLNNLGRYEEALASCDKALEIKPDYHYAWNNRGNALNNLGRYEEALASCDKALEIKPDYHYAWNNRGNALNNLGRYEEALACYDKAIEIKPDYHYAWDNRGLVLNNLGRYEEALASYDKAIEIKPDYHYAWYNRGIALDNLGRYEEAIASYDKALEIKPDHHYAWDNRGLVLNNLGRYEEALASCDKAIEIKPDYHYAWYNRGIALDNLGSFEEALASCDKALEIKPDYHYAWNNRGIALFNLGSFEEALASYDKALEIKPDYHYAWNNRGNALKNLGSFEEALASYDKALEIKPDYHEAWDNRGSALSKLGQYNEALFNHDKALEIQPNYANAFYNKACTYALQSQIELVLENLQQAINLNPDKYREMAKTDSDFDSIRSDNRFQALIEGSSD